MNKLNKKIISFVLLFSICLLVNVSYAEFSPTPVNTKATYTSSTTSSTIAGYTLKQIKKFFKSTDDVARTTMLKTLSAEGYKVIWAPTESDTSLWHTFVFPSSFDVGAVATSSNFKFILSVESDTSMYYVGIASDATPKKLSFSTSGYYNTYGTMSVTFSLDTFNSMISENAFGNVSYIKKLTDISGGYTWDDTSYYYEVPSVEPEQPTMPTNSEIASAVQMFYNSIYQYSNAFDDFFVLYDSSTRLYTYVGHTRGNALGQVIVEPNGYYDGYKFDAQWWKFFLDEQEDAWNWQNISKYFNYYVYTSEGTVDTLKNIGYSNISGLLSDGPWATSTTIIVYSTTDYPVKYITFTEDSPEPNIQTGLIEGDQYTYDENLDITNNNYNPLENFITVNPTINILGNVDFSEINKVFEENKDILNIESASWLFVANNNFLEYFMGFLFILIVFLIISRILGG